MTTNPLSTSGPRIVFSREEYAICGLIAAGLILRLAWLAYTGHAAEDAFITFRIARQIAEGNGFVFNQGERMYGTTTPLLTLLLAAWYRLLSQDLLWGARFFGLLASTGALLLVWKTLRIAGQSLARQVAALSLLVLSSKFWLVDTQGMETPLVIFWMAASWYTFSRGKMGLTGLFCGLLLWTRIDLGLWILVLVIIAWFSDRRGALRLALFAGLAYLPWVIFAGIYFGSPIPQTAIAEWVAYVEPHPSSPASQLSLIVNYLSLFDPPQAPGPLIRAELLEASVAWLTAGLAVWQGIHSARNKLLSVLPLFLVLDVARLAATRATFFTRFFVPSLWVVLIFLGLLFGRVWDGLENRRLKIVFGAAMGILVASSLTVGAVRAVEVRATQVYRYDASLKAMGLWFDRNTPAQATILLEPLGYVGYYSNRTIIDEVGLVTPAVVDLKRRGVNPFDYYSIFLTDYVVVHCDDALKMVKDGAGEFSRAYTRVETFDPIPLDPAAQDYMYARGGLPRNACYEVWQRNAK